jgi:dTMP kinase
MAIEGLDGSGKSTVVRHLAEKLRAVVIRNPPESLAIEREKADRSEPGVRRRWYLDANRVAIEQARVLADQGKPVVLDRSIASTLCFGAAERGGIARREDIPTDFPLPDVIVLLALPESARRERRRNRGDEATSEETRLDTDCAFRERVLAGYRSLCSVEIDASGTPESIVHAILAVLDGLTSAEIAGL